MPRYISRWSSDLEDEVADPLNLTVDEDGPVFTGLLDSRGNEIWRVKDPIGYIWSDE